MPDNRKLRVFLCHASQDKPVVRELYQRLLAEGWIDPWLDEEKLLPGQDWDMEIEKAAGSSDAVMVCLSNTAITKDGYVQKEIKVALNIALYKPEGSIYIIPLRLEDCEIPWSIKSIQYIDYFPPNLRDKSWGRLRSSLKVKAKSLGVNLDMVPSPKEGGTNLTANKGVVGKAGNKSIKPAKAVGGDLKFGNLKLLYMPSGSSVGFLSKIREGILFLIRRSKLR